MRPSWCCSPCCAWCCSAGGRAVDVDREGRRFGKRYEWRDGRERCYWRQERAAHRVCDVVFSYAGHTVVDGVSLQVDRGELVALLGPNGCGKTPSCALLTALNSRTRVRTCSMGAWSMRHIPRIPQPLSVFISAWALCSRMPTPSCSVPRWARKLLLVPRRWGCRQTSSSAVRDAMELFQVADLVDASPYQLSGGQKEVRCAGRQSYR